MQKVAVGDVMTKSFFSVKPTTDLLDCAKQIVKNRTTSLLIAEKNKLLGILTSTDILWAITKKPGINLKDLKALDMATRKVAVIKPSADISQALKKMRSLNFRRLPVLSRGELIGVITLKDILRVDPSLYQESGELLDIREKERKLQPNNNSSEGFCDNCNNLSELLKVYDQNLCPECRDELH